MSRAELEQKIENSCITHDQLIWWPGNRDWSPVRDTEFCKLIPGPPPVRAKAKNGWAWTLAFAPIIGICLQFFIAGMLTTNSNKINRVVGELWFVTLVLNLLACYMDFQALKKSGVKMKTWYIFLVPAYLYKRAKILRHNLAYFFTWIACFIATLLPIW